MFETILACVVLTAGGALLAYATIGRLCGFHRPWKWQGGGQVSLVGELSFSVGILCGGLSALQHSGLWVIPALAALVVLYFSHRRAYRRYAAEEDELRARNATKYPGVFDDPPPDDIDRVHGNELDLFDSGACTHLGRVAKLDLKALIDRFGDMPEQGPNDIFLIPESLGVLPEGSLSQEFVMLLNNAFEKRDFLMLRWMPPGRLRRPVAEGNTD